MVVEAPSAFCGITKLITKVKTSAINTDNILPNIDFALFMKSPLNKSILTTHLIIVTDKFLINKLTIRLH